MGGDQPALPVGSVIEATVVDVFPSNRENTVRFGDCWEAVEYDGTPPHPGTTVRLVVERHSEWTRRLIPSPLLTSRRITDPGPWACGRVASHIEKSTPASPEPVQWDYGDWHHAVMGVQLGTDQGPVTVTWTDTFYPYGVEVFHDPIEESLVLGEDGPQRVGPDTAHPGVWAPYLGSPMRGGAFHWERLQMGPSQRADGTIVGAWYTVDVPIALRLDFPTGAVWFAAAIPQFPEMRRTFIPGDEIMVVFSADKMRDIGFDDPAFLR
jgi:hypothetical protein